MGAGSDSDVIAVLTKDHREVEQLFTQIEQLGPNDSERRGKLAEQAITELVRHSVAEEAYLYPPPAGSCPAATSWPMRSSPSTPRRNRR